MIRRVYNMLLPRSLRYQLLARMLFILSLILLIIGFLQYIVIKDFLYRNESETMRTKLMSMPVGMVLNEEWLTNKVGGENKNDIESSPGRFKFFIGDISLAIIEEDGSFKDLLGSTNLPAPQLFETEYKSIQEDFSKRRKIEYKVRWDSDGKEQLIVFRPVGHEPDNINMQPGTILQMGVSTTQLQDILWQQLNTFIVLSILALATGLAVYFSVIRKTLVPLSKIVNAVQNTNAGNLAERIPNQQGQEEIDRLSDSFNEMLERLEVSFEYEKEAKEQMRRFIADASHELRTPLTSIHGFLEVLLRGAADRPEQLYTALNSMHGESKRIIKLVEDLLLLAKLDRAPELQLSDTSLTELVREMEPQLFLLAGNRTVDVYLTEGIHGCLDADKIKQVTLNLFHNAVQHTDLVYGKIKVSLVFSNHHAKLSIRDNGSGIPEDKLPHIFDRFYRIDASRTRQYGGAGLGLSITKSIVEAHGGTVTVESKVGEGSTFIVNLPLNEKRPV